MDEDLLYIYYLDSNCWKNLKGKMCKFRTCPGGLKCRSRGKSVASASSRLGCNLWGSAVECCQNPVSLGRKCSNLTLFLSNCLNRHEAHATIHGRILMPCCWSQRVVQAALAGCLQRGTSPDGGTWSSHEAVQNLQAECIQCRQFAETCHTDSCLCGKVEIHNC